MEKPTTPTVRTSVKLWPYLGVSLQGWLIYVAFSGLTMAFLQVPLEKVGSLLLYAFGCALNIGYTYYTIIKE